MSLRGEDEQTVGQPDIDTIDSSIERSDSQIDASVDEGSTYDPLPPPQEVLDDLETLSEPDFAQPLEELAAERCGYLFTVESAISVQEETLTIIETRVFDSDGRMIAADIQLPQIVQMLSQVRNRRLQIDYDPSGKPRLVRLSPVYLIYGFPGPPNIRDIIDY